MAGISIPAIILYSIGIFVEPLEAEFGWSRSQITLGLTINAINAITTVILSPLVGLLLDRHGSRRIGLPGAVLYLSCLAALSLTSEHIIIW